MAASSHARYDGVFKYVIEEPFENHKYDAERNPLGVERDYDRRIESAPMVLEYKHNVDALVREFENGEKDEQTIALVVAWEMGEEWKKRYRVISLLDEDNRHRRVCHGQTHEFLDSTTGARRFHGVILGELVAYLNDSAAAQAWQRERYGAEE
jgi:hypothetical protein